MNYAEQLVRYLDHLDKPIKGRLSGKAHILIDSHNADLIRDFAKNYRSLPTEPGDYKALILCHHLKSITQMVEGKSLDELNEDDLKTLNRVMRDRKMKASYEYRKTLKRFLKLKDKKK